MKYEYTQVASLTKGWHILYRQGDGKDCYGIEVTSLRSKEEDRERGYSHVWGVNDRTFLLEPKEKIMGQFGISSEDYVKLMAELLTLPNCSVRLSDLLSSKKEV